MTKKVIEHVDPLTGKDITDVPSALTAAAIAKLTPFAEGAPTPTQLDTSLNTAREMIKVGFEIVADNIAGTERDQKFHVLGNNEDHHGLQGVVIASEDGKLLLGLKDVNHNGKYDFVDVVSNESNYEQTVRDRTTVSALNSIPNVKAAIDSAPAPKRDR